MKRSSLWLFAFCTLWVGASAQAQVSGVSYRRCLLPVVLDGRAPVPGALGSLWRTVLTLSNEGDAPINVYPLWSFCSFDCPAPPDEVIPPHLSSQPQTYTSAETVNGSSPNGVILYVEDRYAAALQMTLRVHDVTRQETAWGTMVPIVPERRFSSAVSLPALPAQDPKFRVNVRIYSLATDSPVDVRVRAFAMNQTPSVRPAQFQDTFLAERLVTLTTPAEPQWLAEVTSRPVNVLPEYLLIGDLASLTGGATVPAVRLELTSLTPGKTIWAFASITNNDTQEVTVVAPPEH